MGRQLPGVTKWVLGPHHTADAPLKVSTPDTLHSPPCAAMGPEAMRVRQLVAPRTPVSPPPPPTGARDTPLLHEVPGHLVGPGLPGGCALRRGAPASAGACCCRVRGGPVERVSPCGEGTVGSPSTPVRGPGAAANTGCPLCACGFISHGCHPGGLAGSWRPGTVSVAAPPQCGPDAQQLCLKAPVGPHVHECLLCQAFILAGSAFDA